MIENKELKLEGLLNSNNQIINEFLENPRLYCGMHYGCWDVKEADLFANQLCCLIDKEAFRND